MSAACWSREGLLRMLCFCYWWHGLFKIKRSGSEDENDPRPSPENQRDSRCSGRKITSVCICSRPFAAESGKWQRIKSHRKREKYLESCRRNTDPPDMQRTGNSTSDRQLRDPNIRDFVWQINYLEAQQRYWPKCYLKRKRNWKIGRFFLAKANRFAFFLARGIDANAITL